MPPVVYAFDRARGRFVLDTPRYAAALHAPTDEEVRRQIAEAAGDVSLLTCAALGPALHAIYTGRGVDEGRTLFRHWYRRDDAAATEARLAALLGGTVLWIRRP